MSFSEKRRDFLKKAGLLGAGVHNLEPADAPKAGSKADALQLRLEPGE